MGILRGLPQYGVDMGIPKEMKFRAEIRSDEHFSPTDFRNYLPGHR